MSTIAEQERARCLRAAGTVDMDSIDLNVSCANCGCRGGSVYVATLSTEASILKAQLQALLHVALMRVGWTDCGDGQLVCNVCKDEAR